MVSKPPNGISLRGTASYDVFCVKIGAGVLAVGERKNPKSRMRRNKTPYSIWIIFCIVVGTPDVITPENCGDDWIRVLGAAGVKCYPFPLTLIVVLTTLSHYRTSV